MLTVLSPVIESALFAESSIANTGRCPVHCAVLIPEVLSFGEAASVPIIYCRTHYCLNHMAQIKPSETILIHAVGAKILATMETLNKKSYLMERYSIPGDWISYSRDVSRAEGVMAATTRKALMWILIRLLVNN